MSNRSYSLTTIKREEAPPPGNVEAEQALLGAILTNNAAFREVEGLVTVEDFSEPIHQEIFAACAATISAGRLADVQTLKCRFPSDEIAPGINFFIYMGRLYSEATTVLNAPDYARAIKVEAVRRAGLSLAAELKDVLLDPRRFAAPAEILSDAASALQKIAENTEPSQFYEAGSFSSIFFEKAEAYARGEHDPSFVRTGFPTLDRMTGGYSPQTYWIVGARPRVGKTALACYSAIKVAERGTGVSIFSLEVPAFKIEARILSAMSFFAGHIIPYSRIQQGRFDVKDEAVMFRLRSAEKRLSSLPISYFDLGRPTIAQVALRVRAEKRRMARKGIKLGVVFIDYLNKLRANGKTSDRRQEIHDISADLQTLAKSEDVCIVLLAQTTRDTDRREDRRPVLADLKESADLEADADVVVFVHREALAIEESAKYRRGDDVEIARYLSEINKAELIVAKSRSGDTGIIKTACVIEASSLFEDDKFYVNGNRVPCFRGGNDDGLEMF